MAHFVIRVGSRTDQGVRPSNQDNFVVDPDHHVYLVADGMGGQEKGDQASTMAVQIIPEVLRQRLAAREDVDSALQSAMTQANQAIIAAGQAQPLGRRMGTTAVLAVQRDDRVYVAHLGDSRAYLIRGDQVRLLTVDHSVAKFLEQSGTLSAEEARHSPLQHVLYKFLGCPDMTTGAEVLQFEARPGDRLLLASDGLTNHIRDADLRDGAQRFADPQAWADYLVPLALERGSRDNVTCVVVAFEEEKVEAAPAP
jgi:protein phosphatase